MKRLYWTEPDVFETEVQVTSVGPNEVVTDPVIFHPDEGGQPEDKGYIGEAAVCNVRVVQGQVVHTLDRPLPDGRYTARLDRERRLATACQHTAQHILSGIAAGRLDLATVAVHIGTESSTIDFDKRIDWDVARDLERQAMAVVARDIAVETAFDAEPGKARSRLGPIESDVIRVVRIGDCDASACCGAHVRSTARIGMIRIFDLESHKGGTRVSFRAGNKALEQSQAETAILQELRKAAGCATADLPATLQKAMDRSKELAREVDRLWTLRLAELVKSTLVVTAGSSRIGIHVSEIPRELISALARMVAEAVDGAGVVISETNIAVCSKTIDAGALLKQIQTHAGGKGGGSPRAANGRLDRPLTAEALTRLLTLPQDPYPA
jgi:alanyl-tRNA synthetase